MIATDSVDFLGHQIQHGEVGLYIDNVDKIRNTPRPKTKKEVRSFIGLVGYCREYTPSFATIAAPLTALTKNKQPNKVEWGEPQARSYNILKVTLVVSLFCIYLTLVNSSFLEPPLLTMEWEQSCSRSDMVSLSLWLMPARSS